MSAITVVGSLNMDFVATVPRLPAPGETISGGGFQMIPGGKGANQACAAAKAAGSGTAVRMVGCTGYDPFADHLRASLSAAGAEVVHVRSSRRHSTGIAMIWVDSEGRNSIVVVPGANQALVPADVESFRPAFRDSSIALFQLETPLDTVAGAMRLARECGALTILDPAPVQPLSPRLFAAAVLLTPNETEACALLGVEACDWLDLDTSRLFARRLLGMGPGAVVIKMGAAGCLYLDREHEILSRGFPVTPVDTTAAGDTFNAALAVALTDRAGMEDALRFANAAAAISVTRHGAQPSAPSRDEVLELARS